MMRRERALLGAAALALALALPAPAAAAEEPVRLATADALLDRTGDGFQDVIVSGRTVYFDLDGDGWFDYGLTLAFKEYTTEGHRRVRERRLNPAF